MGLFVAAFCYATAQPLIEYLPGATSPTIVNGSYVEYVRTEYAVPAAGMVAIVTAALSAWAYSNSGKLRPVVLVALLPLGSALAAGFVSFQLLPSPRFVETACKVVYPSAFVAWLLALVAGTALMRDWVSRGAGRFGIPSLVRAPYEASGGSGVLSTQPGETPSQLASRIILSFEGNVERLSTHDIEARPAIYLDGLRVVPISPGAHEDLFPAEVRSETFRVRRGFDEHWFTLRCKLTPLGCSYRLHARSRSLNGFPILSVLALLGGVAAAFSGIGGPLVFAVLCGGALFSRFTGLDEVVFDAARGKRRRDERIGEHVKLFRFALADALSGGQVVFQATVPPNQDPPRNSESRSARRATVTDQDGREMID